MSLHSNRHTADLLEPTFVPNGFSMIDLIECLPEVHCNPLGCPVSKTCLRNKLLTKNSKAVFNETFYKNGNCPFYWEGNA